jgi:hypothetical protein
VDLSKLLPIYSKVAAGGYAGLLTTVVIGALALAHITLAPPLVALIVTVIIFGAAYLKTETKFGRELAPLADEVFKDMESEGPAR